MSTKNQPILMKFSK